MAVTVKVPASLAYLFQDEKVVQCAAGELKTCFDDLEARFPGFKSRLCNEKGEPLDSFHIYVNGTNVLNLQGMATPLQDGDEVGIIPAAAAG
jgi:Molybdopterin converting factor, small subunit